MVGKPHNLTSRQSQEWDEQAARFAHTVESLRSADERPFMGKAGHHTRGDFGTVTFGIGYGGGRKVSGLLRALIDAWLMLSLDTD